MILAPTFMTSTMRLPAQDPFMIGVTGSFCLGSAIVAIFGLRSPLKFVPLLFLQVCYKLIWFVMVLLPNVVGGQFPFHAMVLALVFVTYVIGDLIAIPFGWLFAREA